MSKYAKFDEWLDEMEGFGTRAERAGDDLGKNYRGWLKAAWELGAAAEREACAKIADDMKPGLEGGEIWIAGRIASAIRARKDKTE